jgi:hypothetical protein
MATNVTQSLFGMTPQAIQSQRAADLQAQALRFAQLTPMQQAQMGLFQAGSQLGTGLAGLMGYEDEEVKQAKARQGLLGGLNMADPQALREAARNADPATAQALITQALELEKKEADIGAAKALTEQRSRESDPVQELAKTGKYTPASLATYAKTRDVKDLVLTEKLSLPEIAKLQEYRDTLTDPNKIAEVDAVIKATAEGRGTKIEIGMGTGNAWKPTDVTAVVTQSRQELNPFRTYLDDAERAINFIDLDNPKAAAQVDRALASLSGDSQLSMAEVQSVATAGSFPQQTVDAVNKFFVGGSGTLSKQQKREVVEVGAAAAVMAHNKRRQELIEAYGLTGAPAAEIERAVGKERTLPNSTVRRMNDSLSKNPQQVVESMGIPYEPQRYSYRISPKGELQRTRKGN